MRSLLLVVCLLALPAFAEERKLAVGPIEGVMSRGDAAVLEEAVRAEARAVDVSVVPGSPASAAAAADMGATHVVLAKALRLEGALAVMLTLVKAEGGERIGTERLVGYTMEDLKGEAKKKVPRLMRAGGLAAPLPAPTPTPTTTPRPTAA